MIACHIRDPTLITVRHLYLATIYTNVYLNWAAREQRHHNEILTRHFEMQTRGIKMAD